MASSSDDHQFEYERKGTLVTDRGHIAGLLRRLSEAHTLLTITLPDSSITYTSVVLSVHPDKGYVLLDELSPERGHKLLLKSRRLHAYGQLQGVDLRFSARVADVRSKDGVAIYILPLPEEVDYQQMRAHFRVPVGRGTPVPVRLQLPPPEGHDAAPDPLAVRPVIEGELHDISEGGIGALLTQSSGALQIGDLLACTLHLPSGEEVEVELEVRYLGEDPRTGHQRLGGRFRELPKAQKARISRFVLGLQREMIRKQPR